jgi:hypothetical protein
LAPDGFELALNYNPGDLSTSRGLAIDHTGNVWIANSTSASITELSPTGDELSPSGGYTAGGTLNHPEAIYFDSSGNAWVTNFVGNTIEALDSSGNVIVSPFGSTTLFSPTGLVVDSFNTVWACNVATANSSMELTVSTTTGSFSSFVGGFGLGTANWIIADKTVTPNIIWVANTGTGGVSRIVDTGGSATSGAAAPNGGQCWPTGHNHRQQR